MKNLKNKNSVMEDVDKDASKNINKNQNQEKINKNLRGNSKSTKIKLNNKGNSYYNLSIDGTEFGGSDMLKNSGKIFLFNLIKKFIFLLIRYDYNKYIL